MMTNPQRYLIRMFAFLLVIAGIGAGLYQPLAFAFYSNMVINSIILAVLFIGIAFIVRQNFRLIPEHRWIKAMQRRTDAPPPAWRPTLLATIAVMLAERRDDRTSLSAQNLRSVLDGVAVRLDESREVSRYLIGLLVFLGLLGTFWGLLLTVQSVGQVIEGIDITNGGFDTMLTELKNGLNTPISGMATAFSSSLFGLAGSLVLGFLDLQLGQASSRFFNDVEDWLSKSIHFADSISHGTDPELVSGLSESAADKMQELAKSIAANEQNQADTNSQLHTLTMTLNKLTSTLQHDSMLAENIANLDSALQHLAHEMKNDRAAMNDAITLELRALSKTLTALMRDRK